MQQKPLSSAAVRSKNPVKKRKPKQKPVILGLTGSIGMGKSETARMFRRERIPVFDADATVHQLMAKGGAAVAHVAAVFPTAVKDGAVDRKTLGGLVFNNTTLLRKLEAIMHPLVRQQELAFLHTAALRRDPLVVLDIPLLYETRGEHRCDYVAVVTAPAFVQKSRVLRRPGMTEDRLKAVLRQQVPDREKRRRADFVIETGLGKRHALMAVRAIIRRLSGNSEHA